MSYLRTRMLESPLGLLRMADGGSGVCALGFVHGARSWSSFRLDHWFPGHRMIEGDTPALLAAQDWLSAYFRGEWHDGTRLSLDLRGSEFDKRIWSHVRGIGRGETLSYGELAELVGQPDAARAVGGAVGRNPVSLILPCHRVLGSAGKLTGYAAGIDRKQWLLQHEGLTLF